MSSVDSNSQEKSVFQRLLKEKRTEQLYYSIANDFSASLSLGMNYFIQQLSHVVHQPTSRSNNNFGREG